MAETFNTGDWIDRYLKEELSVEELERFELRLMDDTALQDELEAALAVRQALSMAPPEGGEVVSAIDPAPVREWAPWATAASVALAVVCVVALARTQVENAGLQERLRALEGPRSGVLTVTLDPMRSGSPQGTVVYRPADLSAVLLDIPLPPAVRESTPLRFELRQGDSSLASWKATTDASGRITTLLDGGLVPDGLFILVIRSDDGEVLEQRAFELVGD